MPEPCESPYLRAGDLRTCWLPYNHDDDCATANKAAAEPHTVED